MNTSPIKSVSEAIVASRHADIVSASFLQFYSPVVAIIFFHVAVSLA